MLTDAWAPGRGQQIPPTCVVVAFCIICARAMSPGDALESRRPAAGVARGLGVMRSSVQAERRGLSRGQPASIGDNVSGEGRAAHAGSAWQRHTTAPTRDEEYGCCGRRGQVGQPRAQKWAVCPALGRDTWAGRRCWRSPDSRMSFLYQRLRTIGSVATGWHVACTISRWQGERRGSRTLINSIIPQAAS